MRLVAAALCAVMLIGCSDSDEPDGLGFAGDIRHAMTAVDEMLGGPQRYSEVNATESEANVFVVREDSEGPFVVRGDAIEPPPTMTPYEGPTFTASDVTFTEDVLAKLSEALPDSKVVALSITPGTSSGTVDYIATVRGAGGEVRVLLSPTGEILDLDVN